MVIVPYGGGTNVTKSLMLDAWEKWMIVSLDMTWMNQILNIDKENMTVTVQAGIIGA